MGDKPTDIHEMKVIFLIISKAELCGKGKRLDGCYFQARNYTGADCIFKVAVTNLTKSALFCLSPFCKQPDLE